MPQQKEAVAENEAAVKKEAAVDKEATVERDHGQERGHGLRKRPKRSVRERGRGLTNSLQMKQSADKTGCRRRRPLSTKRPWTKEAMVERCHGRRRPWFKK